MAPSNKNQSIDLQGKLIDWFLYDKDICRLHDLNWHSSVMLSALS